jgi:adenylosuccinate synthase
LPGWGTLSGIPLRSRNDLPKELLSYIAYVEKACGVPIMLMSTGPGREETLVLHDPWPT